MAELHRLFFALWPDDALRERLARASAALRQRENPAGRWLQPARYHLTLVFVGDFPQALPPGLAEGVAAAAARLRSRPFELLMDRAGSFRNREIPWWLGPSTEPPQLRELFQRLREELRSARLPYDANLRLTPHLTVLRNAGRVLPVTPIPSLDWNVGEFVLVHSIVGPQSEYRLLGRWPLDPQAPETVTAGSPQLNLWDN